jgi:hypothetical protein
VRGELRPCPFCGATPHLITYGQGKPCYVAAICGNPECAVSIAAQCDSEAKAVEVWNRRDERTMAELMSYFDRRVQQLERLKAALWAEPAAKEGSGGEDL